MIFEELCRVFIKNEYFVEIFKSALVQFFMEQYAEKSEEQHILFYIFTTRLT